VPRKRLSAVGGNASSPHAHVPALLLPVLSRDAAISPRCLHVNGRRYLDVQTGDDGIGAARRIAVPPALLPASRLQRLRYLCRTRAAAGPAARVALSGRC